jgi:hypothetical protein
VPYNPDYYLANRETILARSRAYWQSHQAERAAYNKANREKKREYNRAYQLLSHGLTQADFDVLLAAQGGGCGICGGQPGKKGWQIDHDHDRVHVRGILCSPCNVMLGMAHDNPTTLLAGVAYLGKDR